MILDWEKSMLYVQVKEIFPANNYLIQTTSIYSKKEWCGSGQSDIKFEHRRNDTMIKR